jgi:DNA-3-methyladenine glycosylase II
MNETEYIGRLDAAAVHLREHDPVLAPVIAMSGRCEIRPHTDYYEAIVNSILGQQLSTKVARVIRDRFAALGGKVFPAPEQVMKFSFDELRAVGLSGAKIKYVQDLAAHVLDGRLDLAHLAEEPNEAIITAVTDVKGVGEWTAHMFLMFCVGRLDVLPTGDLGIRKGVQGLYGLKELPAPLEIRRIAERNSWTGYESVASWYVWRSIDMAVTI